MNHVIRNSLSSLSDTVNSIAFTPDSSHILTCSTDGSIAAVRCGNWMLEKHWKSAHKGSPVNCLSIHPSGKLALSLGGDGVLRTWNLVKGRQAYATNLVPRLGLEAKNITVTKWSPNGERYLIATNFKVVLYSVENAGIIEETEFKLRVTCVEFINDQVIIIGHDNGQVAFYDLDTSAEILLKDAHETRVKSAACINDFIATASSSGEVKLWRFTTESLVLLATEHCGARITCLVIAENFAANPEVKKEEIVINDKEVSTKKKNVFKIRQEVIIEDEDGDEIQIKTPKKSSKKLKPKSKTKSLPSTDIEESKSSSLGVGKKSKLIKKKVLPSKEGKKKKKKTVIKGLEHRENDSIEDPITPNDIISSKKVNKKRKVTQDTESPSPNNTEDLAPSKTKKKNITALKTPLGIIKKQRKIQRFNKMVKQ